MCLAENVGVLTDVLHFGIMTVVQSTTGTSEDLFKEKYSVFSSDTETVSLYLWVMSVKFYLKLSQLT